jgi:protein-S-isoprenylcysteine O-methyltransferase Ste14
MLALKVLLFILLVQGTALAWLPYFIVRACGEHMVLDWWALPGPVAIALGGIAVLICDWDFATSGKGTPAPIDPPKKLVVRGLYRLVRNPMYVGVLAVLLGESLLFRSVCLPVLAAGFWLIFHLFVVLYEEPTLYRTFGSEYEAYCATVPRWIPGRTAWKK